MSAPLVVNTADGVCWTRRTVTSGGIALYAPERVTTCPDFVMATLPELAEHGIVGSADVLPVPVGPEPQDDSFRFVLYIEGATDREDASWAAEQAVSAVEGQGYKAYTVVDTETATEAELLRARVAELETDLAAKAQDAEAAVNGWGRARDRIAELEENLRAVNAGWAVARNRVAALETERHETNEVLSDSAEALRANRDRIAELEYRLADREQVASTYPPALPWAKLMDHEDLADFLDELGASAITYATAEVALAEVESSIARWRVIAEAQHAHNTAPGPNPEDRPGMRHAVRTEDDVTPQVAKLRALLAGQREQTGGAS